MFVCVKCRADMRCDKNGVGIDYGHGHVYAGDRWKCPKCGHMIINCNDNPIHDPEYKTQDEYLISNKVPTCLWYAYLHVNQTIHVKRYMGDYGDIQEARDSDFVVKVTEPFEAKNRENAIKIANGPQK